MESKLRSSVAFEVAGDAPHKVLTAATDAGLAAARERLAAGGSADAIGSLGSVKDGTRRVKIELTLRAAPAAAMDAERAFADAFLAKLTTQGYAAARL